MVEARSQFTMYTPREHADGTSTKRYIPPTVRPCKIPYDELKLPKDFIWGFATAAYQIEGYTGVGDDAKLGGGRGSCIWDGRLN
jgi:hypothetical protein